MAAIDIKEWYQGLAAGGVAITVAAFAALAAVAGKGDAVVTRLPIGAVFFGVGLFTVGIGETRNHLFRSELHMDDWGRAYAQVSGRPRRPNAPGVCLDIVGAVLAIGGLAIMLVAAMQ